MSSLPLLVAALLSAGEARSMDRAAFMANWDKSISCGEYTEVSRGTIGGDSEQIIYLCRQMPDGASERAPVDCAVLSGNRAFILNLPTSAHRVVSVGGRGLDIALQLAGGGCRVDLIASAQSNWTVSEVSRQCETAAP